MPLYFVYILSFVLAFCSFGYEMVIAKALEEITGNPVLWHSVTVGIYVSGLGVGTFLADRMRKDKILWRLGWVEAGLSIIGAFAAVLIFSAHGWFRIEYLDNVLNAYNVYADVHDDNGIPFQRIIEMSEGERREYVGNPWKLEFAIFLIFSQCINFVIGVLSGFEIPLLLALASRVKGKQNVVLGIGYFGTLAIALLMSYWGLPQLGVLKSTAIIAAINATICLIIIAYSRQRTYRLLGAGALGVFSVAMVILYAPAIYQQYLKVVYYYRYGLVSRYSGVDVMDYDEIFEFLNKQPDITHFKSIYQNIDFVPYKPFKTANEVFDPEKEDLYALVLNTKVQFLSLYESYYHEGMSHVPIKIAGTVPKKILVLGAGDAILMRELLRYKEVESITQVELDPMMHDISENYKAVAELNEYSLSDPRVKVHIGDAFFFLRNADEKYDAIFIDFPYPYSADIARLYSKEFYTFVKSRLSEDGFAVADVPLFSPRRQKEADINVIGGMYEINSMYFNTMNAAGFDVGFYTTKENPFVILYDPKNTHFKDAMYDGRIVHYHSPKIDSLRYGEVNELPYKKDPRMVNSIFLPKKMGFNDPQM